MWLKNQQNNAITIMPTEQSELIATGNIWYTAYQNGGASVLC
jgi:hypothetical protein